MESKAVKQKPVVENRAGKAVMLGITTLIVGAILAPLFTQPETRQVAEVALRVGVAAPWALLGVLSARSNSGNVSVDMNI